MTHKALIIDDDPAAIDAITDSLRAMGHQWDIARSRAGALALLRRGRYDVVLLDIRIPSRPGDEASGIDSAMDLLDRMGAMAAACSPVIVTVDWPAVAEERSADLMGLAVAMAERGVVDVIEKPFPRRGRTLDRTIAEALLPTAAP